MASSLQKNIETINKNKNIFLNMKQTKIIKTLDESLVFLLVFWGLKLQYNILIDKCLWLSIQINDIRFAENSKKILNHS
jgi:hypothetical protein